jgi:hypothetical protein
MSFIVYDSVETIEKFRSYTEEVADHFGSDTLAEHYLNGFINWDGSPTQESIEAEERCKDYFGW